MDEVEEGRSQMRMPFFVCPKTTMRMMKMTTMAERAESGDFESWMMFLDLLVRAQASGRNVGREIDEAVLHIRQCLGAEDESAEVNTGMDQVSVRHGGKITVTYVDGCADHPNRICDCNVRGGSFTVHGPTRVYYTSEDVVEGSTLVPSRGNITFKGNLSV